MTNPIISKNFVQFSYVSSEDSSKREVKGLQWSRDSQGDYILRVRVKEEDEDKVYISTPIPAADFKKAFNNNELKSSEIGDILYQYFDDIPAAGKEALGIGARRSDVDFKNDCFVLEEQKNRAVRYHTATELVTASVSNTKPIGLLPHVGGRKKIATGHRFIHSPQYIEFKMKLPVNGSDRFEEQTVVISSKFDQSNGLSFLTIEINGKSVDIHFWGDAKKDGGSKKSQRLANAKKIVNLFEYDTFWAVPGNRDIFYERLGDILSSIPEKTLDFLGSEASYALAGAIRYYNASVSNGEVEFSVREFAQRSQIKRSLVKNSPSPKVQKIIPRADQRVEERKREIIDHLFVKDGQFFDGSTKGSFEKGKLSAATPKQLWQLVLNIVDRSKVIKYAKENELCNQKKITDGFYDELVVQYLRAEMREDSVIGARSIYLGVLMPAFESGQSVTDYIKDLKKNFLDPSKSLAFRDIPTMLSVYRNAPKNSVRRALMYNMMFASVTKNKTLKNYYDQLPLSEPSFSDLVELRETLSPEDFMLLKKIISKTGWYAGKEGALTKNGLTAQFARTVSSVDQDFWQSYDLLMSAQEAGLLNLDQIGLIIGQMSTMTDPACREFAIYAFTKMAVQCGVLEYEKAVKLNLIRGLPQYTNPSLTYNKGSLEKKNDFHTFFRHFQKTNISEFVQLLAEKKKNGSVLIGLTAAMLERQGSLVNAHRFLRAGLSVVKDENIEKEYMHTRTAWNTYKAMRDENKERFFTRSVYSVSTWEVGLWRSDHKKVKDTFKK